MLQVQTSSKRARSHTSTGADSLANSNATHEPQTLTLRRRKNFTAQAPDTRPPRVCKADREGVYSHHTAAMQHTAPDLSAFLGDYPPGKLCATSEYGWLDADSVSLEPLKRFEDRVKKRLTCIQQCEIQSVAGQQSQTRRMSRTLRRISVQAQLESPC